MRTTMCFIWALLSASHAQGQPFAPNGSFERTCSEIWVSQPPFHISSSVGMGEKTYENFRSRNNVSRREAYIPKRSIVRIDRRSRGLANHPQAYVPVEVIGVNDTEEHLRRADKLRNISSATSGLERVELGQIGFLHTGALERAGDHTFLVKENSPVIRDNGLRAMGVVAIRPLFVGGKYLVKNCCSGPRTFDMNTDRSIRENPNCSQEYQFELMYSNGNRGRRIGIDAGEEICRIAADLVPLSENIAGQFESLNNFLNLSIQDRSVNFSVDRLEILDSAGLVKIPLDQESFDGHGMNGPYGSYNYNVEGRGEDSMADPTSACAFMQVLKRHQELCPGEDCQAQFGDFFHKREWRDHNSHGNGDCVDIRPFRKSASKLGLSYCGRTTRNGSCLNQSLDPEYDQIKTRNFINLLKEAGGSNIIFNDPGIYRNDRSVTRVGGHDNHLHVCFNPDDPNVQRTCADGIP